MVIMVVMVIIVSSLTRVTSVKSVSAESVSHCTDWRTSLQEHLVTLKLNIPDNTIRPTSKYDNDRGHFWSKRARPGQFWSKRATPKTWTKRALPRTLTAPRVITAPRTLPVAPNHPSLQVIIAIFPLISAMECEKVSGKLLQEIERNRLRFGRKWEISIWSRKPQPTEIFVGINSQYWWIRNKLLSGMIW